jgi:hypothetical protein
MEVVTAEMKAAQPGVAKRYREHNNDQQRLYVCVLRRAQQGGHGRVHQGVRGRSVRISPNHCRHCCR